MVNTIFPQGVLPSDTRFSESKGDGLGGEWFWDSWRRILGELEGVGWELGV